MNFYRSSTNGNPSKNGNSKNGTLRKDLNAPHQEYSMLAQETAKTSSSSVLERNYFFDPDWQHNHQAYWQEKFKTLMAIPRCAAEKKYDFSIILQN
jgi:hypothetical protein